MRAVSKTVNPGSNPGSPVELTGVSSELRPLGARL